MVSTATAFCFPQWQEETDRGWKWESRPGCEIRGTKSGWDRRRKLFFDKHTIWPCALQALNGCSCLNAWLISSWIIFTWFQFAAAEISKRTESYLARDRGQLCSAKTSLDWSFYASARELLRLHHCLHEHQRKQSFAWVETLESKWKVDLFHGVL